MFLKYPINSGNKLKFIVHLLSVLKILNLSIFRVKIEATTYFFQGHTGKQLSQDLKLDLSYIEAHTVFTLPSWLGFRSLDFSWPQNPPLTSSSGFLYFHHAARSELFLGFPSPCDRNATHLQCADLRLVLINAILPSSSLQGTRPFFATFQHHMAHSHATWLPYILPPYAHYYLNPFYMQFDKFSLLLDFWALLLSQVSLLCHVSSHFMAVNMVWLPHMSIIPSEYWEHPSLYWHHIFLCVHYRFKRKENTSIQNGLTLLHKLNWGPPTPYKAGTSGHTNNSEQSFLYYMFRDLVSSVYTIFLFCFVLCRTQWWSGFIPDSMLRGHS